MVFVHGSDDFLVHLFDFFSDEQIPVQPFHGYGIDLQRNQVNRTATSAVTLTTTCIRISTATSTSTATATAAAAVTTVATTTAATTRVISGIDNDKEEHLPQR